MLFGGTGVHHRNLGPDALPWLRISFERIHSGCAILAMPTSAAELMLLPFHFAGIWPALRIFQTAVGLIRDLHGRIVERARAYTLATPVRTYVSRRDRGGCLYITSHYCSVHLVDVLRRYAATPMFAACGSIRIRHDLASDAERACTIALIANSVGYQRDLRADVGLVPRTVPGAVEVRSRICPRVPLADWHELHRRPRKGLLPCLGKKHPDQRRWSLSTLAAVGEILAPG